MINIINFRIKSNVDESMKRTNVDNIVKKSNNNSSIQIISKYNKIIGNLGKDEIYNKVEYYYNIIIILL